MLVIEAKDERGKEGGRHDGVSKERGSQGAKESMVGGAREKDNFLAPLLNESVSIATIQPATGERGEKWGCTRVTEGRRKREKKH